jgi:S-adenosylmethionine:tRNA ribosyltransferase-isomerase
VLIEDLSYALIPENVEGTPREIRLGRRDRGRLLVVDRAAGTLVESRVELLPTWMTAGDVLVLNNSKRIPGVLHGRTPRGGKVELRFVDLCEDGTGLCSVFPKHDVRTGTHIQLCDDQRIEIVETNVTKHALARASGEHLSIRELLKSQGTPILGFFYKGHWSTNHLNPFYATEEGSVESPLAGLHFTPDLVEALQNRGVDVRFVTLHSVGSWLPFLEEDVAEHRMWSESFCVPQATADSINNARNAGRRIFACGSTSLRAIESAATKEGHVLSTTGRTDLYITPGYRFRAIDAYFTNFHQFQTSLMVLDAAFCGVDLLKRTYREASTREYSFYEFGDALLYI